MVNASSCTIELRMHLGGFAQLTRTRMFIDVINVLSGNMKHARALDHLHGGVILLVLPESISFSFHI